MRLLVQAYTVPLSSPHLMHEAVCEGSGGRRAVTGQRPWASVLTERSQDAFVGSSMANGATMMPFALRTRDVPRVWGTTAPLWWRQEPSQGARHARSTCHNPMLYRCSVAQGASLEGPNPRRSCTPASKGVSPAPQRRHRIRRLSCSLAVGGGVRRRHMALLFAALFLLSLTTSSIKRWLAAMGAHCPPPEALLRQGLAITPATACPLAGSDPLGTDHGVRVGQDAQARRLITPAAASDHGAEARPCRQQCTARGLHVTAACSDDAPSWTEASKAVSPQARLQADHVQTVQPSWGPLNQALLSSRRQRTARGEAQKEAACIA